MLLYLSRHQDWVCSGECPEQLPGDITLEGSHDLLGCAAFASSTFDIGASLGINPHPHDDDGGQCSVQAAVTAAIEPVAHRVT